MTPRRHAPGSPAIPPQRTTLLQLALLLVVAAPALPQEGEDPAWPPPLPRLSEPQSLDAARTRPAPRVAEEEGPPALEVQITLGVWIGGVEGHLQTPRTGQPGTTSHHRPTTQEIGLTKLGVLPYVDLSLVAFGSHELHVTYVHAEFHGRDRLAESLVSQRAQFPRDAIVNSGLILDTFRLTYRAPWLSLKLGAWSITPEVGIALTWFDYTLTSRQAQGRVGRAYSFLSPYVGGLIRGELIEDTLALEVQLGGSAYLNGATVVDAEVRLVRRLWEFDGADLSLVLGVRGSWLRRRDAQPLEQNDPNMRLGVFSTDPIGGVTFGLRLRF
ncbi:MAG: hypothetical protein KDD82_17580 [Planctomycetes bacterium]|nr:hypothetical protein [Planctomycetota bacterium]